ncbi:murein L,D-transpeptidase catalytic domain family protein [Pedobacter sp. MC2016-14]|uniref:murein L,D-transpeptidase catalytic domain family protein n=1 Tax=Pedobacter sp. MC2016-14 TaxID=2897327 RepID=UPI001E42A265|nr:murein L,D-transpeptidase catalytic domain family protein [Pedobacter sp. MC2016-14]MCD0489273.1 murein L,D-transpeptidase catalytic domain family protein [Pedobacter sp. MC2016-14]
MRKYILGGAGIVLITLSLFTMSWKSPVETSPVVRTASEDSLYNKYVKDLYDSVKLATTGLSRTVFEKAITGYYNLKITGKVSNAKSILSIADMDQLSSSKRLWIIDLDKKELLLNTWVAHGQHSGDDKATRFSNTNDSFQSSLGFYVTGEIYTGKHGRSLKLDGMDNGYNDNARRRSIVVHGAAYVSQGTINALGRLGRSQGCPAVAPELANEVINTIEGKTVLFINSSDQRYTSKFLDEHKAADLAGIYPEKISTALIASGT